MKYFLPSFICLLMANPLSAEELSKEPPKVGWWLSLYLSYSAIIIPEKYENLVVCQRAGERTGWSYTCIPDNYVTKAIEGE